MVGRLPGDYNIVLSVHYPDVDRKAKKALLHSLLLILIVTHTTTITTIITKLYYYNYYIIISTLDHKTYTELRCTQFYSCGDDLSAGNLILPLFRLQYTIRKLHSDYREDRAGFY